jgi:hypothetical protein
MFSEQTKKTFVQINLVSEFEILIYMSACIDLLKENMWVGVDFDSSSVTNSCRLGFEKKNKTKALTE